MAAMKLLVSEGRRLCLPKPHLQLRSSSFSLFQRCLSSDSEPKPPSEPSQPSFQSVPVQPVSYPTKPKEEVEIPSGENEGRQQQEKLSWTREDIRYMKDTTSISPVSYPSRVAPLPEDRADGEGDGAETGENVRESVQMERERRKIEAESRRLFRVVADEEEKMVAPFPRLIKPEKKEKRPIFELTDAIKQVKANARKTFDETIEAHVRLGIDKARSDLIVRGTFTLPHGDKKVLRIAVFAEGSDADEARAAGADVVGGVELIDEIASSGKIDFDKCFATRQMFNRVLKLAKILNRHGLMPDKKQGTVVSDVAKAVKEAKKNQIKFRMDKSSIVHVGLGKVSLIDESLRENVGAFMNALLLAKPAGLKKTSKYAGYVSSVHICSTMGPGFPVSVQSISKAVDNYNRVHLKR